MSGKLFTDVEPFSETALENPRIEDIEAESLAENRMDIGEEVPYAEPLAPEEIRWFYKDGVDKRWVEFCGYDSLRIEDAWRKKLEKERNANETNDDCERVVVKGGMYDVKLDDMKCVSIFWAGEEWEIMRATWYYEASWIPLELEHSRVIEESHLRLFEKRKSSTAGSTPEEASPSHSYRVLHTERFSEFHVDWHAINDVALYSEYTTSKLMRSVTSRLGFSKTSGYQLRRGYKVNASMSDKPNDIDHLVFVVHGIGQKRDTQKIIRNTALFRDCVDWCRQKYFASTSHRVEFFPVEWRSSLKLDGDIVDAITPYSVLSIRHLLNSSAMDILYYTSPLYGGEVRAGLQRELNRLYCKFISRHPDWKGKVSVLAHSLGCVIVYDIVTGWMGPDTRPPSPATQEVVTDGLKFTIENMFCLGSPLSVFLALRTRTPSNRVDVMPPGLCKRFYNIFHWSDPVAYRMEPLLVRGYRKIDPVLITSYGGANEQQIDTPPVSLANGEGTMPTSDNEEREAESPTETPNPSVERGWSLWGLVRAGWNTREVDTTDVNPIRPDEELEQRLDYVLRAGAMGRNYLYTVRAHTAYWNNYDVAYFVLTRLFPNLET
ncbi:phospholipase DDHD1 [Diachasma alloeum]|uniref:phospholipase DDHD1 n=1 Tax=Diachasma alloeum TaxID=454923 RepID=UPI0007381260|nr:phospholipase DDHD1 [Diachasma alloeum]